MNALLLTDLGSLGHICAYVTAAWLAAGGDVGFVLFLRPHNVLIGLGLALIKLFPRECQPIRKR